MRISIWQQFSSNHSADFTIVGTFESEEKAAFAAEKLRYILRTIASYWQQLSESEQEAQWMKIRNGEITPIESKLSQVFGVEWSKDVYTKLPRGIDWLHVHPDEAAQAALSVGKHVFVQNIRDTCVGSEPFATLLKQFGATVSGFHELGDDAIRLTVTCLPPDDRTREQLLADVSIDFPGDDFQGISISGTKLKFYDGRVQSDGSRIRYFVHMDWVGQLLELMAHLQAHGCTDIQIEFSQE